jgi:multimeric flavodoxin WrbA
VTLKAIALNCSLKPSSGEASSTDAMIAVIASELAKYQVTLVETVRVVDFDVKPGVTSDEGQGDAWPDLRRRILDADILILGTPVWLGQMSSVAKRVLERMDAFLQETDDRSRMPSYGKVALAAVVGNEDGAHGISAHLYQALNDTGWTVPASAIAYWVGEAMGSTDFKEMKPVPEVVTKSAALAASNAAHLAALLKSKPYPGIAG